MFKKCGSLINFLTGYAFANKGSDWLPYLKSFLWNPSSGNGHGSDKGSSVNGRYCS